MNLNSVHKFNKIPAQSSSKVRNEENDDDGIPNRETRVDRTDEIVNSLSGDAEERQIDGDE